MSYLSSARKVLAAMDAAGEELSNQKALECKCLYRQWEDIIGAEAKPGRRFLYGQALFKVRADAGTHVFSREWSPGPNTASLYEAINEAHAGTAEDPIPWVQPMALAMGLYYSEFRYEMLPRALKCDFSWRRSAKQYMAMYLGI